MAGEDADDVRGLLDGEAAEVAQLDDLRLFGVERGQPRQRLVEREHVDVVGPVGAGRRRLDSQRCVVERDALRRAAALGRAARPRALHEDLAHRERGDGEEVRAVGELARPLGGEPDERFVDERRGLQRLARAARG